MTTRIGLQRGRLAESVLRLMRSGFVLSRTAIGGSLLLALAFFALHKEASAQNPVRGVIRPPVGSKPLAIRVPPLNQPAAAPNRGNDGGRGGNKHGGKHRHQSWRAPRFYGYPYYGVYSYYGYPSYSYYGYGYPTYGNYYGYPYYGTNYGTLGYRTGISIRLGSGIGVVGWAVPRYGFVPRSIYFGRYFGRSIWFSAPLPPDWPLVDLVEEPSRELEQQLQREAETKMAQLTQQGNAGGLATAAGQGSKTKSLDSPLILVSADKMQAALRRSRSGDADFRQGDFSDAVRTYRRVIAMGAEIVEPHAHLAFALLAEGEYEQAADEFERALELDANWLRTEFTLADFYGAQYQSFPAHLEGLAKVAMKSPENAKLLLAVGICLELDGDEDRAALFVDQAIALEPRFESLMSKQ